MNAAFLYVINSTTAKVVKILNVHPYVCGLPKKYVGLK